MPFPGHYLGTAHARKWWNKEHYFPKVADVESYASWIKTGKKDMLDHEGGSAGHLQIEVPMDGLLRTADNVMLIKCVAKMTGRKSGKSVTFMPKPIRADSGSGLHVHQTLWKGKRNLFYDQSGYGGFGNRIAAVRFPAYANSAEAKRIESRPPDATCSIYFCLAAQLLAGLDGVEKQLESSDYGPYDEDIHKWPKKELKKVKALPTNLARR